MGERESAGVVLHPTGTVVSFGPFRFDRANRLLSRESQDVPLPPRALGILESLVERPGAVVSKQALIAAVWKDAFVTETSLTEAISQVRQALGDDPQQPTYIQTVHRRGYRFVAPVTFDAAAAGPLRLADRPRLPAESEPPSASRPHAEGTDPGRTRSRAGIVGAFVALVAVALVAVAIRSRPAVEREPTRLSIPLPTGEAIGLHGPPALALAPDGQHLVYALARNGVSQLHLRAMDRFESTPMPGTEGGEAPFLSPDGQWVGYFADRKLKKVALGGGTPVTLADAENALGASWGDDGFIVFSSKDQGGLFRVPASGGTPEPLTQLDEAAGELKHLWPQVLPGSRAVLFTIWPTAGLEQARVATIPLTKGAAPSTILTQASYARFLPGGHVVFTRKSLLMAATFDPDRPDHAGEPAGVFDGVTVDWFTGAAQLATAANGSLVYVPGTHEVPAHTLVRIGRDGVERPLPTPPRPFMNLDVTRDGRRVVATIHEGTGSDLWSADIDRGALTRLTFEAHNIEPAWAPDGKTVTFASSRAGPYNLYSVSVDGSRQVTRLLESPRNQYPEGWSADGRLLLFSELRPETGSDLWVLTAGTHEARPLLNSRFEERAGALSPDSRFLAYESNESGRGEVYVRPYPELTPQVRVSSEGGMAPRWSRDGRELYFATGDSLMAVNVSLAPEPRAGPPRRLFPVKGYLNGFTYALAAEGEGFVALRGGKDAGPPQINVVLDWSSELRRLLERKTP